MNKLIIAGNGFDLAHGLPTSYNHFMDAFWRDLKDDYNDELVKELVSINENVFELSQIGDFNNYRAFTSKLADYTKKNNFHSSSIFTFKNQFFKELNQTQSIQNWVDVENEYYQSLKEICKDTKLEVRQKRGNVVKLHQEFEQVKKLLVRYLNTNVIEAYDFYVRKKADAIANIIKPIPIFNNDTSLLKEFSVDSDRSELLKLLQEQGKKNQLLTKVRLLNFNYTPTLRFYGNSLWKDKIDIRISQIHGELNKNIIFGFGDEMDEDYKLIEDMDDNEYLRYFKSFQYSQNSNYKDVLRYIDSEKFQVIIMGHSCGLSDRVLLNTIFEHENCRSIKVYYYKNGDYDNYTEIIQNISRHFNDKQLMRTKIVEKTLCEPMPQIQIPKKK